MLLLFSVYFQLRVQWTGSSFLHRLSHFIRSHSIFANAAHGSAMAFAPRIVSQVCVCVCSVCGQQKLMKNIIRSFIAITCALRRFEYMLFQFQLFFSLNSAPAFYFFFRFISLLLRLTVFFMHSANTECRMRKRWYISCKFRHIMTDMVAGISFRPKQSRANYGSMKSRRRFDEKSTVWTFHFQQSHMTIRQHRTLSWKRNRRI